MTWGPHGPIAPFRIPARIPSPILVGLLAGLSIGLLAGLSGGCSGSDRSPAADAGSPQPLPTVRAERRALARTLPWYGTVESRRAVTVVALQAGRVVAVEAADGDRVARGDVLFRLAGPAAEHRRVTLEQKVASLEERTRAAEETAELRRRALAEQLVRRDEVMAAESDLAAVRQELTAARQELEALASALDLRAPAAGTFTGLRVAVGQDVAAGETLARLVDARDLRVTASIHLPSGLAPPSGAPVAFDGGEDGGQAPSGARIVRVLPDRSASGATRVWIEGGPLSAAEGAAGGLAPPWAPGETVSGSVRLPGPAGAVAVPAAAVARDAEDRPFVFVPDEGGSGEGGYRKQAVTTGVEADGWVEVTSGLAAGTEVVSEGAYELLFRDFGATYRVPD